MYCTYCTQRIILKFTRGRQGLLSPSKMSANESSNSSGANKDSGTHLNRQRQAVFDAGGGDDSIEFKNVSTYGYTPAKYLPLFSSTQSLFLDVFQPSLIASLQDTLLPPIPGSLPEYWLTESTLHDDSSNHSTDLTLGHKVTLSGNGKAYIVIATKIEYKMVPNGCSQKLER